MFGWVGDKSTVFWSKLTRPSIVVLGRFPFNRAHIIPAVPYHQYGTQVDEAGMSVAAPPFSYSTFPCRGVAPTHSRGIPASRSIAGPKSWRKINRGSGPLRPVASHDDWNPGHEADPSQPDLD